MEIPNKNSLSLQNTPNRVQQQPNIPHIFLNTSILIKPFSKKRIYKIKTKRIKIIPFSKASLFEQIISAYKQNFKIQTIASYFKINIKTIEKIIHRNLILDKYKHQQSNQISNAQQVYNNSIEIEKTISENIPNCGKLLENTDFQEDYSRAY